MAPISRRIRELRGLVGLSARELSRLAGLPSESHVGIIESSEDGKVTSTTASGLARVLGCSLDWLIDGRGKPPSVRSIRIAVARARGRPGRRAA